MNEDTVAEIVKKALRTMQVADSRQIRDADQKAAT